MRVSSLVTAVLLIIMAAGCTVMSTATPTTPSKQPEPQRPLVRGEISGLPDDTLATIYVRLPPGRVVDWGRHGNGLWECVVRAAGGVDKVVTAEAEGYISSPVSYTIHLSGTTAYVVKDGQITTDEALHLDFHFKPVESP